MSNRYALLIGVDYYFPNQQPGNSWYPSLGGCVRDVRHVEEYLINQQQIPKTHLLKLTASSSSGLQPPEPPAQWPTYENMVAAFQRLTTQAQPGDYVYIHYSGHGGRARTTIPERRGAAGIDEGLVPTDIGNSEARYLRDHELAKLLNEMVAKGLVVSVVLDSCHSGGMTRGGGDVAVRGVNFVDETPRPVASLVGSHEELLQAWDHATAGGTRNVALGSGWLPEPQGYTLLAACRPSESAYEYAFDGTERNGALTYWLLDALEDTGPALSYKVLHDRIVAKVHSQFENQTPQLQGEGDRVFFGSERVQPYYAAPVMQVDLANQRLLLGAGQAHGLRAQAKFAIYPRGVNPAMLARRQAVIALSQLGATESWATIVERFTKEEIEQGAQAVLLGAGAVRLVQKVWMARQKEVPATIDQGAALQAVVQALQNNGWIEVATTGDQVDYNVAVNTGGEYEIWDRTGQVINNLRPPVTIGGSNAAADIARRLVHLAKYNAVKQLSNNDPMSPLARKVEVELVGKRATFDPADPFEAETRFTEPGRTPSLTVGEWTAVRIKNNTAQNLNVTLLDLQPDWGVSQVYPPGSGDHFVEFEPGQEMVIPLQAGLPPSYTEGKDVVKVFATVGTSNFRWLELPALDQPLKRSASVRSEMPQNSLERLLAAFTAEEPPTRNLVPAAYPSHEWITAQVEVNIKQATSS